MQLTQKKKFWRVKKKVFKRELDVSVRASAVIKNQSFLDSKSMFLPPLSIKINPSHRSIVLCVELNPKIADASAEKCLLILIFFDISIDKNIILERKFLKATISDSSSKTSPLESLYVG